MANYEIIYFYDGFNMARLLIKLGERTKPVVGKTTFAFTYFQSDKNIEDITMLDPEVLNATTVCFGEEYNVDEYISKFPDSKITNLAKWNPSNYVAVRCNAFRAPYSAAACFKKNSYFECFTPSQLDWQVSVWGYELTTKQFEHRLM